MDINCWLEGREGIYCVSTFDLSEKGVSLISSDPASEGDIMTLKFFTPFSVDPITVQGKVIWRSSEPEGRIGVRFLEMNDITKSILKSTAQLMRTRGQME